MAKEMLINVSEGEECRIALLEDGKLQELYMERTSSTSHVGNIYKGRVTNVEPSIQAAFVDFGLGRNGFLHISDLMPSYFGRRGEDIQETVGRKLARRDRPPIQRCLRRGDEIVVQIIKEGIGTKGPTLTTYLSIPGKILVMMPGVGKSGVSRKIEDDDERRRLRQILDQLDPPDDAGFIIRTAGVGATKAEIQRDLTYLSRLWANFKKKRDAGPGPAELYTEGDLVTRTVRDVFTSEVDHLIVDNKDVAQRIKEVVKLSSPRTKNRLELYEDPLPLFHKYGIEREIEMMYSRHVPLPSGGSLVIDSTEAIVAIDVNSGKFRDHSDAETTAFKTDMEAADEICRQLKLRDLGGVIICDFIDLRYERHRRELERRLNDLLKDDRAKTKVLPMSQFGIIEMTRQRMRPSLKRSVYFDCPHCKGAGLVKTPESMSLDVMRRLRIAINDQRVQRVELAVCPDVAFYLQNKKRLTIGELEAHYDKRIVIRSEPSLGLDEMRIDLFDNREGLVFIEALGALSQPPHTTQLGTRPAHVAQRGRGGGGSGRGAPSGRGGGGGDDRRGGRREPQHAGGGGRPAAPAHRAPRDEDMADDRFERVEDDVEEREHEIESGHAERPARPALPSRQPPGPVHRRPGNEQDWSDEPTDIDAPAGSSAGGDRAGAAAGAGSSNGNGTGDEEGDGGRRRRRRRRRGRRGRGRGRDNGQPQTSDADQRPHDPTSPSLNADREDEQDDREFLSREPDLVYPTDDAETDRDERVEEELIEERVEYVGPSATPEEAQLEEEPLAAEPEQAAPEPEPAPKAKRSRSRRPTKSKTKASATNAAEPRAEAPAPEPSDGKDAAGEPDAPKARRRTRGSRGGRGRKGSRGGGAAAQADAGSGADPAPAAANAAAAAVPFVRTGSTDRHLIEDDPILPQPVRRPRSARDLDNIPDDFD